VKKGEFLGPSLSSSGVDSGRETFGLTPRPAQFALSSNDPDFSPPTEIEEIEWRLALGSTLEEEGAPSPGPNLKSGGMMPIQPMRSADVVERSG